MIRTEELTPKKHFDVIVSGGGVAGVAAAVQAAREGKSVLLLEKSQKLGGLATLGLINLFVPMCNGRGKQIIKGMAEEFLRRAGTVLPVALTCDDRSTLPLSDKIPQQRKHLIAVTKVKRTFRLIQQKQLTAGNKRARHDAQLLLPLAQVLKIALFFSRKPHTLKRIHSRLNHCS